MQILFILWAFITVYGTLHNIFVDAMVKGRKKGTFFDRSNFELFDFIIIKLKVHVFRSVIIFDPETILLQQQIQTDVS